MTTYPKTIQIQSAIAASVNAPGTLLAAIGADEYAIINIMMTGTADLAIGGNAVYSQLAADAVVRRPYTAYVGPGQSVTVTGLTAGIVFISGVLFKNVA